MYLRSSSPVQHQGPHRSVTCRSPSGHSSAPDIHPRRRYIRNAVSSIPACPPSHLPGPSPPRLRLSAHAPHGTLFPPHRLFPCRARWTLARQEGLTPSFESSNSGEWCYLPVCVHFHVLRVAFLCAGGWHCPPCLWECEDFSRQCFALTRLCVATRSPGWAFEAKPTGRLPHVNAAMFVDTCEDSV